MLTATAGVTNIDSIIKYKLLNSTTISRTVHNFYFYGEKNTQST